VDFLALLAHRAAASRVVSAAPQGATVEPVFELLAILRFPCLDRKTIFLLNLVTIPLWYDIKRAEGDDPEVRG